MVIPFGKSIKILPVIFPSNFELPPQWDCGHQTMNLWTCGVFVGIMVISRAFTGLRFEDWDMVSCERVVNGILSVRSSKTGE